MVKAPDELELVPIGVARTPYDSPGDAPHQGFAADEESTVEIYEASADALSGMEQVHRVTVVYWGHLADRTRLVGDDGGGAFSRRSLHRPNPLGICTCLVLDVDDREIRLRGLDAVDGSPVLDVKPAVQGER